MLSRWFGSAKHASSPAGNHPTGEGLIRISTRSLIGLHHGARSLRLEPARIRSQQSGGYLSPFKGRGMEFDEVRPYLQGDDVRTLDWRVTARTGRAHTKLFREERERSILLWVDLRQSMFFATQGAYKAVRAAQAAALLGWSANYHGDRLGGLLFTDAIHEELRPKSGKPPLLHLLNRLGEHACWDQPASTINTQQSVNAIQQALSRLRRVSSPGSLIFLISDFSQLDATGEAFLSQLARHNDLIMLFIHDPMEAELPPPGQYSISDGKQTAILDSGSTRAREEYQQRFQAHQARLQQLARRPGIIMLPMSTADDPLIHLQKYFGGKV